MNATIKSRKQDKVKARRREFVNLYRCGLTQSEIAKAFNYSQSTVSHHITKYVN